MDASQACQAIGRQGYCVLEDLLDPAQAADLDRQARPLMQDGSGYVKYEGALNTLPQLAPLCAHPLIRQIADQLLGEPNFLVNNVCLMWVQPGAALGGLHSDWPLGEVPQPYPPWPLLLQTMWMLTDFTAANGATQVVPGTHLKGHPPAGPEQNRAVPVTGPKGSVLVWHGALWHRQGPNSTADQHRMGANIAYIPRFVHRPPIWPAVRRSLYETFPPTLQQLLERSVEPA